MEVAQNFKNKMQLLPNEKQIGTYYKTDVTSLKILSFVYLKIYNYQVK